MSKPASTTLVVIDVQKYFVSEYRTEVPRKIARYIDSEKLDKLLFARFINDPKSNFPKTMDPERCVTSPDTDIAPELERFTTDDNVFSKAAFSVFANKELASQIDRNSLLLLCGLSTECCVLASAFNAFEEGYQVNVLKDLCASRTKQRHQVGLELMEKNMKGILV